MQDRFKVIPGGGKPKPYRARAKGEPDLIVCPECNSTMMLRVRLGMIWQDGKARGGTPAIACAKCYLVLA
jgi:DNA-directed RNA polymerase subunit RPC12/RpoP